MKTMKIEYENLAGVNKPYFKELKLAFEEVLESGWFILGKSVENFEKEFSDYIGVPFCAGVASGLDALTLSIKALNIPEGSEIIVPSNTYIATILSILQNGNKPVLVEPDIRSYNIDPKAIEAAITKNTKALIVVHLYGKCCNMDPILDICRRNNIYLIEDCAQAHGAMYKGQKAGSFGDLSAFSFYPTKNLGCLGDGGAITTNNKEYYVKVKSLRNYGSERKYYNTYIGFNSRLDELQAAFLSVKLKTLDKIINHKRELARIYLNNLRNDFILPEIHKDFFDVYHVFNIRHSQRDKLKDYLLKNGINTEIHYPLPPHKQKALSFLSELKLPVSEEIHLTTLSLPISTIHSTEDIMKVAEVLNAF
jgi:dTDP-4-amino-4,6-dideoxygalactose transaminase